MLPKFKWPRMRGGSLGLCLLASGLPAGAQMRADQSPVIEPPPPQAAPATPDLAPEFAIIYRRAGQPRIALMWNKTVSDRTQLDRREVSVRKENDKSSTSGMEKTTAGDSGSATTRDNESNVSKTTIDTKSTVTLYEPKRSVALPESVQLMLERGFTNEMSRGGVAFVDRALAMRLTAASQHRSGVDQQLLETDALKGHAEWIMEVLWVTDKQAPSGVAFDVRVKSLVHGTDVASVYSRALPLNPERPQQGRWIAGTNGYEFVMPQARNTQQEPYDMGVALAHDVMQALGRAMATSIANSAPSKPVPKPKP